ncbi:hypothetical protein EV672_11165 [Aquabacterium commune]|uniref:Secreted protein with PEP-CTERM sorting signal n=1 Tax=Aquabacterium commune TaxID=70586 RepID=A0A4R6R4L6_9BURK|nr:hypothetical protein [Aquabacterium commune]TDP80729.1 hypothetical protein EV672_11165 [Aquabacterium commune]
MRRFPMMLHRRCRLAGGSAALWLLLMTAGTFANAAPGIGLLAPGAAHATSAAQALRPRDMVKTPPLPARRPVADSASLALLLGGLVVLWRTAERRTNTTGNATSNNHTTTRHRPEQKESAS